MRPTSEQIFERFQANIALNVARNGIHIQSIMASEECPSYVYTVGMTNIGASELIIFGIAPQSIAPVLMQIFHEIRMGGRPANQDSIHDLLAVSLLLHEVQRSVAAEFTGQGDVYLENQNLKPTYRQMLWPDEKGKYPHEAGFDSKFKASQPYIAKAKPRLDNDLASDLSH